MYVKDTKDPSVSSMCMDPSIADVHGLHRCLIQQIFISAGRGYTPISRTTVAIVNDTARQPWRAQNVC
jgi:hypothetical protein